VAHFLGIMGPDFHLPPKVRIACIGPVTEAAAKKAGLPVDILQERYTIPELVDTIAVYFEKMRKEQNHAISRLPAAEAEEE
jgi:uroporphyrinogen III methyltransferase/synthase